MTPKLNLAETYNLLKQIYESFFFEPFEIENREKKELLHSLIYYLKQQGISFFEEEKLPSFFEERQFLSRYFFIWRIPRFAFHE